MRLLPGSLSRAQAARLLVVRPRPCIKRCSSRSWASLHRAYSTVASLAGAEASLVPNAEAAPVAKIGDTQESFFDDRELLQADISSKEWDTLVQQHCPDWHHLMRADIDAAHRDAAAPPAEFKAMIAAALSTSPPPSSLSSKQLDLLRQLCRLGALVGLERISPRAHGLTALRHVVAVSAGPDGLPDADCAEWYLLAALPHLNAVQWLQIVLPSESGVTHPSDAAALIEAAEACPLQVPQLVVGSQCHDVHFNTVRDLWLALSRQPREALRLAILMKLYVLLTDAAEVGPYAQRTWERLIKPSRCRSDAFAYVAKLLDISSSCWLMRTMVASIVSVETPLASSLSCEAVSKASLDPGAENADCLSSEQKSVPSDALQGESILQQALVYYEASDVADLQTYLSQVAVMAGSTAPSKYEDTIEQLCDTMLLIVTDPKDRINASARVAMLDSLKAAISLMNLVRKSRFDSATGGAKNGLFKLYPNHSHAPAGSAWMAELHRILTPWVQDALLLTTLQGLADMILHLSSRSLYLLTLYLTKHACNDVLYRLYHFLFHPDKAGHGASAQAPPRKPMSTAMTVDAIFKQLNSSSATASSTPSTTPAEDRVSNLIRHLDPATLSHILVALARMKDLNALRQAVDLCYTHQHLFVFPPVPHLSKVFTMTGPSTQGPRSLKDPYRACLARLVFMEDDVRYGGAASAADLRAQVARRLVSSVNGFPPEKPSGPAAVSSLSSMFASLSAVQSSAAPSSATSASWVQRALFPNSPVPQCLLPTLRFIDAWESTQAPHSISAGSHAFGLGQGARIAQKPIYPDRYPLRQLLDGWSATASPTLSWGTRTGGRSSMNNPTGTLMESYYAPSATHSLTHQKSSLMFDVRNGLLAGRVEPLAESLGLPATNHAAVPPESLPSDWVRSMAARLGSLGLSVVGDLRLLPTEAWYPALSPDEDSNMSLYAHLPPELIQAFRTAIAAPGDFLRL